jgi:hypothetical protein
LEKASTTGGTLLYIICFVTLPFPFPRALPLVFPFASFIHGTPRGAAGGGGGLGNRLLPFASGGAALLNEEAFLLSCTLLLSFIHQALFTAACTGGAGGNAT